MCSCWYKGRIVEEKGHRGSCADVLEVRDMRSQPHELLSVCQEVHDPTSLMFSQQAKEGAFRNGDRVLNNQARNTLNKEISVAKRSYAKKLENQFSSNDPASVWKGLKDITNYKTPSPSTEANQQLAEDLNEFYCRFETAGLTPHAPSEHLSTKPLATPPPALQISEDDVHQIFLKQKRRKAPGPDGITPACLKTCADQLAFIFSQIFNRSLELCEVPAFFKRSTIIPIPKKPKITGINDYRSDALMCVVMKSFERLVLAYLKNITGLHFIQQHLDKSGTYVRLLFVDFSLAFNTIIPTLLQTKLTQLSVPSSICQWITSFLTDRHQLVKLGKFTSYSCTTSTGAPQGCVLSPLLFSLYTNDCTSTDLSVKLLKFTDDTTVISLIQDGDESAYRQEVEQLAAWCSFNNLELNTLKTVEMIVDFRRNTPALPPLTIMNSTAPTVESFRFLGTTISQDLKWDTHIDSIIKKAQQTLYFRRQLRKFNLPQELPTLFYSAVIDKIRHQKTTENDIVCEQATEPVLVRATEIPQDQMTVSLAEAVEKHQKALETITQLEKEKSDLMYQVGALKDIREDLEYVQTELCEKCDKIMDEYTRLKDTHNILQAEHEETEEKLKHCEKLLMVRELESHCTLKMERDELKKTLTPTQKLLKECERDQEAHRRLNSEYEEMMETLKNSEKLLKVSLAEAEEKYQKAVRTISQLENEKSNLMYQVGTLKDTVEELEEVQAELRKDHDEIMDEYDQLWATHNILQAKHKDTEEKLIICEELIIVEKLESHHAIKMERDELKKTLTSNKKLLKECERDQEAHRLLKSEYEEMRETLKNSEKLLKVSLAQAVEKHQKDVETITQLEKEKFNLTDQVKTLQDTVQDLGSQLCDTRLRCDELKIECERDQEAHRRLKSEYEEMKETLKNSEKLLKVSLAEAVEKHQKDVETITQLEKEKFNLTDQVKTLQDTVEDLGSQLCDTRLRCDELKIKYERVQEAHRRLKSCCHKIKETVINVKKFMKVSLAEAEEKHQKDVETITQLEKEKSNLTDQVKTLQDTVEDLGSQLCDTRLRCDELKIECERDQEAHRLLKSGYKEMIKTVKNIKRFMKVSLVDAEEKHQKDVETITKLEKEKFNLTDQVKTLQDTVEDLGSQLCDTHLWCDELKNECERDQEAHRRLKSEYEETIKTVKNVKRFMKVSLVEAEEKHQKALETITKLEKEKSNLMYQVGTLKDIREELEYVQTELCEKRDKIMDEYTRLKDTHKILQAEHEETEEKLKHCEKLLMVRELESHRTLKMKKNKLKKTLTFNKKLLKVYERGQEAHRLLKSEYEEMMETLKNVEKFMKVSLTDAAEKHQKDVKFNLINQVGTLKDTVESLVEVQTKLHKDCDKIMDEYTRLWDTHNILQAEHEETEEKLKRCEKLLMVEKLESHCTLKMERDELKKTLTSNKKLLKECLDQAEESGLTLVGMQDRKHWGKRILMRIGLKLYEE
ncbi:hypothetical protein QTP70_030263 [Hemibagrus guttatus]|uniref:Reverse transcriptase domain-containing protein n=1 Tax=Hemibagrus guttatus TaxID=175788 RepID=A0AAE0V864_9TELE|nr:hypothetical protein QTP70_030263 [Hemibagrus guttatus]